MLLNGACKGKGQGRVKGWASGSGNGRKEGEMIKEKKYSVSHILSCIDTFSCTNTPSHLTVSNKVYDAQ